MMIRSILLAHPILFTLLLAWFIAAGAMFLPVIKDAYDRWQAEEPQRRKLRAYYQRARRRPF